MNWAKAKNILIIAFLITNLILLYALTLDENHDTNYSKLEKEFVQKVISKLKEKNIKVDCTIPDSELLMSLMSVEYQTYNPTKIGDVFLKDYSMKHEHKNDEIYLFKNDKETMFLKNKKEIIYEKNSSKVIYEELDDEKISSVVVDFLKEKKLYKDDYKLVSHKVIGKTHILEYTKYYKGMCIEPSYMIFEIDNTGIKKFKRKWLNPTKVNQGKISIRSAPEALLRLLSRKKAYGKTIKSISVCYYFDLLDESLGHISNTLRGDAIPAWRIYFEDGTKIFLEEY